MGHNETPRSILKNRLDQRLYANANSGAGNKRVFALGRELSPGEGWLAADIVLCHIPAPGPYHPTWYLFDKSGVRMVDLFGKNPPWRYSLLDFFQYLIDGRCDFSPKDFHLSRFNMNTGERDSAVGDYYLDDSDRLCLEYRGTNSPRNYPLMSEGARMAQVGYQA